MIRVCVVDAHEVVRLGVAQALAQSRDMRVVEEAASGEELLAKSGRQRWDAVLLDLSPPGGLETIRRLRARFPRLPVLVFTRHPEERYGVRAVKLGAAGYLTKDRPAAQLAEAVRAIASGSRYITPALAERLAAEVDSGRASAPHEDLSNREHQVFGMLVRGTSITRIAGELGLSARTVSTNRARLLRKLGLRGNAELIYYAIRHRLVDEPAEP